MAPRRVTQSKIDGSHFLQVNLLTKTDNEENEKGRKGRMWANAAGNKD